jgi:hypothetical protein
LTGNAGLTHLGRFAEKLKLPQILRQHISISRAENARYEVGGVIMMVVIGVLAGAKHLSHMAILRTDSAIRSLFNWKQFPDDTTLGRIFKLFGHKNGQELSDVECMARPNACSSETTPMCMTRTTT